MLKAVVYLNLQYNEGILYSEERLFTRAGYRLVEEVAFYTACRSRFVSTLRSSVLNPLASACRIASRSTKQLNSLYSLYTIH
jgi:hypothetical protein